MRVVESRLRPIEPRDHRAVLALNEADVDLLAPLDEERLVELVGWADLAAVIEVASEVVGFVLTFGPESPYRSENYRWFDERLEGRFLYLDRIVLHPSHRRRGISSDVYDRIEARALAGGADRMVLEVNVEPPNEASLAFHTGRGYRPVGQLGDDGHRVALLEKRLPGDAVL